MTRTVTRPVNARTQAPAVQLPTAKWKLIDPKTAQQLLGGQLDGSEPANVNRLVSPSLVETYARDMHNGQWLTDGSPIRIDTEGVVRDGQHRLRAIIESGVTLNMLVVTGVDPDSQAVMDAGRPRSVRDQLRIDGITNVSSVAAIANLTLRWNNRAILNTSYRVSRMELVNFVASTKAELHTAALEAQAVRAQLPVAMISAFGAFWFNAFRIDEAKCISFFEGIRTGELLEANDPVSVMRNHLIRSGIALGGRSRQRPSKTEQLAELAWVWNKWRQGEPIRAIRIPKNLTSATYPVLI